MDNVRLDKIKALLEKLTFKDVLVELTDTDDHKTINITLPESESGVLIGYHGEKIDALQLIVNLIWNQHEVVYSPIQIDVNGYRQRRRVSLEELATKAADNAVESGREILLPHLPAYERRIIHLFLEKRSDVSTYSEGEDEERRLVVRPCSKTE